jgi:hypothetical protein
MVLAYFHNVIHLLSQLTDKEQLRLAVTESAKILPYVVSSRKSVKLYLKVGVFFFVLLSLLAHPRLCFRNA